MNTKTNEVKTVSNNIFIKSAYPSDWKPIILPFWRV